MVETEMGKQELCMCNGRAADEARAEDHEGRAQGGEGDPEEADT